MDRSIPVLMVLIGAAVPAFAQNSTSPAGQAASAQVEQQTASGADETAKILFARNPDLETASPDAGLEPMATPPTGELSPALASELAQGGPKYRKDPLEAASTAGSDLRLVDRPKNDIPRLPVELMNRYVVQSKRVEIMQGRDLYTTAGLVDIEFRDHPGLRVGNFFNLNSGAAYESFLEEERLVKMDDLKDTARAIAAGGDAADARDIMDAMAEAYMRTESVEGPVGIK